MGGKTTKLFRNSSQPAKTQDESDSEFHNQLHNFTHQSDTKRDQRDETIVKNSVSPFIHYRKG